MVNKCETCGKEFVAHNKHLNREREGIYCSRECFFKSRNKRVNVICEYCGSSKEIKFYRYNDNANKRFFCDNKCRSKYYKDHVELVKRWNININEELIRDLYVKKKYTQSKVAKILGITTSTVRRLLEKYKIKCRVAGDYTNGKTFTAIKKKLLLKRGSVCEICGWDKSSCDAHHIKPLSKGGTDSLSNLIVVCPNCHRLIHHNKIKI